MTPEQAQAVLQQIDRIKKDADTVWQWQDVEMLPYEEAQCLARFNVAPAKVKKWFDKATANAFVIVHLKEDWYRIRFDLMPVERIDTTEYRVIEK